jgi:predicted nucleic acid-binding protein
VPAFLDTNILLRHLLQDHAAHSAKASAFLARLDAGELSVHTSDTVVFETVFNLQKRHGVMRSDIRDQLLPLLDLPTIRGLDKALIRSAFEYYVDRNISFADAYHVALMRRDGIEEIVTFDRDFDRVPGIRRVEPS